MQETTKLGNTTMRSSMSATEQILLEDSSSSDKSDLEEMILDDNIEETMVIGVVKNLQDRMAMKRRRGPVPGRVCILGNHALGHAILMQDYFTEANADISQGDFSEIKADRKYRQHSQATVEPSPVRIVSVVLGLPASTPIDASPVEDQRSTDAPAAVHGYQQVVVDVPKPPSSTPQQPESPSPQQHEAPPALVVECPSRQQLEAPPAPVVAQSQHQLANGPVSFRRRPRKMAHPVRAPFF